MGIGGISIWQLLIILAIVIMLFGTKRLRTLGSDLGAAVKGFRKTMGNEEEQAPEQNQDPDSLEKKEQAAASDQTTTRQTEKPDA